MRTMIRIKRHAAVSCPVDKCNMDTTSGDLHLSDLSLCVCVFVCLFVCVFVCEIAAGTSQESSSSDNEGDQMERQRTDLTETI